MNADPPLISVTRYCERVKLVRVRFDETVAKKSRPWCGGRLSVRSLCIWSVDDGLDDDVLVLQGGSFRLTVTFPFIPDDIEFG